MKARKRRIVSLVPLKSPINSNSNCAVSLDKKTARKTECSLVQHRIPIRFVSFFFVSSVCFLVCVTMVDKNKAVVCCFLTTSAIILSEKKKIKRKMWSKKWYLKRYISCGIHLLNELLDGAIVVSAGKLRNL